MVNMMVYAENNSSAELIAVIDDNVYDSMYEYFEKWALANGYTRVTEAFIEADFQVEEAIAEINRMKREVKK